ncbi:MAG: hypothetical protein JF616_13495 [Fibrobacteres bacterium]|nr:hypothetical protein [Fibrobacterota bacterium]
MSARGLALALMLATGFAAALEKRERVAPEQSPAQVLAARVQRLGARSVLREIYERPAWADVKAGIVSADPAWLEVGDALRAAAEGDAADELDLAFAEAISRDPQRVLEYARGLDDPGAFADLCGALPLDAPVPQCQRALIRRRRALLKLPQSIWPGQSAACLAAIDSAYAQLGEEEEEGE